MGSSRVYTTIFPVYTQNLGFRPNSDLSDLNNKILLLKSLGVKG